MSVEQKPTTDITPPSSQEGRSEVIAKAEALLKEIAPGEWHLGAQNDALYIVCGRAHQSSTVVPSFGAVSMDWRAEVGSNVIDYWASGLLGRVRRWNKGVDRRVVPCQPAEILDAADR